MAVQLKPKTPRAPERRLQLRIELAWIQPVIWRQIVVPESITLPKLHQVIQVTMGWQDCHLHAFDIAGETYGVTDPDFDFDDTMQSEQRVRLGTALGRARSFRYTYDFGDSWEHLIKVEKRLDPDPEPAPCALCIAGANACPPDDVGGEPGYINFVAAMADPQHPEHDEMLEWYGQAFDPACFDLVAVNRQLKKIKL
jgi:hypothetical protein